MNSVDFAKLASTYLKLPSQVAATAAEELYAKGIVSYPRTETQIFDESIDLQALVTIHTGHSMWGAVAQGMVCPGGKFERPRPGEKHDGAHPPRARRGVT
jgi:DNA topoisomerase-3